MALTAEYIQSLFAAQGQIPTQSGTFIPASTLSDTAKTTSTGTQTDNQFAAQLIGKEIPIFVGGQALMGCRDIEGPFLYTGDDGNGYCDMIVSPALAATPGAARTFPYLSLNGTKSWTLADGFIGDAFASMEINFLSGTEEQTPFASSIARYGAHAVPYRSHICVELKKIPLNVFANEIPFVSLYIHESDYLTRNDGLAKLAQYARFSPDEYEFAVSGHDAFWIVAQQTTFIQYLQNLQKTVGRNWNIVPSDKLRVFESVSTVTPIRLTRDDIVEDTIKFSEIDPLTLPAIRSLGFIDTGRDNDYNTVSAQRARFPIALTSSESTENFDLSIGMEAPDAKAAVSKSLLIDDIGRDRFACTVMPWLRGLQSGDIIEPDVDSEIDFPAARILTVARGAAKWTADITAERVELSLLASGPDITSNGGGTTAAITIEENTTAVTTVTATGADATGAFSIVGGADAEFFTIDADTGVLAFLSAPDFESPLDADGNNQYQLIVKVTGNGLNDTQVITVTVANVDEGGGDGGSPIGLLLALTNP
ncbi:cadherin repeat domain-containing protein (plasmid) [Bradyrhizobium elkanii]|uniref:cadherin repeat domain-containing protein n=1 Tax=Bradyrhizobium elkanii TaxID=29448 RepID=UPI0027149FFD|nr:cadherin repeat domain-containing protein [Bradyrhizobium elkanii]WLB14836.1 cadherin repeat domain-containing protein [Bradyrhizobium elkanii]WLB69072.1 cadherin repeat domain-containing protein [Bradyrhizobium elkanii]